MQKRKRQKARLDLLRALSLARKNIKEQTIESINQSPERTGLLRDTQADDFTSDSINPENRSGAIAA